MVYREKEVILKSGVSCLIRNAEISDAADLIDYLKVTSSETPYLMRDPEEITLTMEQEKEFIQRLKDADRELLLIATVAGKHVGNCSLSSLGSCNRYSHRCSVAIALYQKYCGLGIGKAMMQMILETARECGYEQAELEVVTTNSRAVGLYQNLGFEIYGEQPHSMKYKDGTYANEFLMVKSL